MTIPTVLAESGSVSHGTMRLEDLIPTFALELRRLEMANNYHSEVGMEAMSWTETDYDDDDSVGLLEELIDLLDNLAPEGYYFGTYPGDGADFGYWELEDGEEIS